MSGILTLDLENLQVQFTFEALNRDGFEFDLNDAACQWVSDCPVHLR